MVGKGSDYYGASEAISSVLLLHQRRLAKAGAPSHDSEEIFARYTGVALAAVFAHSRYSIKQRTNSNKQYITIYKQYMSTRPHP